jgi:hypothetical protein
MGQDAERERKLAALGGNALLRRGESLDAATQRRNVAVAALLAARRGRPCASLAGAAA